MRRFFSDVAPRRATCRLGTIPCVLVLALLLLPGIIGCQTPMNNSAALDEVASRLNKMTVELATKQDLAAAEGANAAAHRQLTERVDLLTRKVEQDIPAQLTRLGADLSDQRQRSTRIEAAFVDNFDSHVRVLEEGGRHSSYEETSLKSVRPLSPPPPPQPDSASWGIVKIENNMATWQQMEVNGFPYGVAPLRTVNVIVPAGTATTRLVGFEGTKSWRIGAPDYVQRVIITPKPAFDSVARQP